MSRYLTFVLGLALFTLSFTSFAKPAKLSVEDFSKGNDFSRVTISPDGNYVAAIKKHEGKNSLIIVDTTKFAVTHAVAFPGNAQVGEYHWVNNERVILEKEYLKGWQDTPIYYGELFAVNVDGSRGAYVIGYHGEQQTGTRLKKQTPVQGTSYLLDPLLHDDKKVLVVTYPWTATNEPTTVVYEVDVYRGLRTLITRSPAPMGEFLTDHDGNVRIAVSSDDYLNATLHVREPEGGFWKELDLEGINYTDISLKAFDKSGESVYATASKGGEAESLIKINLKTKEVTKIFQDKHVSPSHIWVDEISKELFAIETEADYPSYAFVDSNSPKSQRLKDLLGALPGSQVQLVSSTEDDSKNIIFASSDINPGQYYLYDANTNKLRALFSARGWINQKDMAQTTPLRFKSRDGLTILAYLTVPNGKAEKNLPLVVMPHGGPYQARDYWGYDPEAQMLANRGIAVLKVNFRGSPGFGQNFREAGYRQWGQNIQHDIIDGVKLLINDGTVDKDNICIMGASFGGYSALQSAIIEPDMFKCAIGLMGVYDLPLMYEEGDTQARSYGVNFLKTVIGTDEAELKAFSPAYNVDKLKAPVLIVHGGEDERAPIEQAESLEAALKKAKHPYEITILDDEGHGFYKEEHRTLYYKKVLAFLDDHLKL